ncbi:MAG: DUF4157 domain-containing protein [Chloroflexota bacterium]|nr:DUF4157 domain-containing protein [Chloroflexota bacterium]
MTSERAPREMKSTLPPTQTTQPPQMQPEFEADPQTSEMLQLQRLVGNQAVQRMLAQRQIQTKLEVGAADDVYEQEANRVASDVMRMSDPALEEDELQMQRIQREALPEEEELQMQRIQREALPEEDELQMQRIQRASAQEVPEVTGDIESTIERSRGGGQAMPDTAQEFFGSRMGQDFSGVNIHTGAEADTLNRQLEARAFTTGSDIYFRDGEYNPDSSGGKELLAHELTHVVQQGASVARKDDES